MRLLIVEDERAIAEVMMLNLKRVGYECEYAQDGEMGAAMVEKQSYDLVLLDIMLPKINGYELMEYLAQLQIPVIFITAKGSVQDRVKGLHMGADDYLVKPFDMVELTARVEAVLRRYNKTERLLRAGDVTVDVEARMVTRAGRPVVLTNKEFGLLLLFIRNKNVALFRETLYEKVWEGEYSGDSRTLDLHVQRLRRKLGWENSLVAVYKVGYRLEVPQ